MTDNKDSGQVGADRVLKVRKWLVQKRGWLTVASIIDEPIQCAPLETISDLQDNIVPQQQLDLAQFMRQLQAQLDQVKSNTIHLVTTSQ